MNPFLGVLITVFLLAVNAFFVAAEFAVTSSRRAAVEPLLKEGKRGAKPAMFALEHVSVMLAVSQVGITIASTTLGVIAEPAIAHLIQTPLAALGVSQSASHGIAFVVALLLVLFLHVVFGEMVPKNISIASPERALLLLAPSLVAIGKLLRPVVVGLDHVANWFIRLAGMEPKAEIAATYTIEEVASIIQLSTEAGKLQDDLGLLTGTLEFTEETAGSLMVPTNKLVTLEEPVTAEVVETMVAKTGFSRFPVTNHEQQIIGYVHLKDVLVYEGEEERTKPIEPWRIRKLGEVGFDEEAEPVLRQMQEQATHMIGVVKDQTLVGVLFLEDLLEELVGQVSDSLQRQAHLYDPNAQ